MDPRSYHELKRLATIYYSNVILSCSCSFHEQKYQGVGTNVEASQTWKNAESVNVTQNSLDVHFQGWKATKRRTWWQMCMMWAMNIPFIWYIITPIYFVLGLMSETPNRSKFRKSISTLVHAISHPLMRSSMCKRWNLIGSSKVWVRLLMLILYSSYRLTHF